MQIITEITDPEQIITLPWSGNFAHDKGIFALVDEYIAKEKDERQRARAEMLVSWYGMGEA
jgi:hypothetical protein